MSGPRKMIRGLESVYDPPDMPRVVETRYVRAPDGTVLLVRRRRFEKDGVSYWTAEVPLDIAKEVYDE